MKHKDAIEHSFLLLQAELGDEVSLSETGNFISIKGEKAQIITKSIVQPETVSRLLYKTETKDNQLIIANYISPNAKQILRENLINYIDFAGNMWIKLSNVHIRIEGKTASRAEEPPTLAFQKSGLKLIFQLLNQDGLLSTNYRTMALASGVSLGTVSRVIDVLKREEFLAYNSKNELFFVNIEKTISKWQSAYCEKLKPSLFFRKFKPLNEDFYTQWNHFEFEHGTLWGGEPAGSLLTSYLNPEIFTLYTNQSLQELVKKHQIIPDDNGKIYVYRNFWSEKNDFSINKSVNPLIVYADLLETPDSRCTETANLIYARYLQYNQ